MQRIDENTYIDDTLVTCAEYQLFIDEMREQGKLYQPDHWTSYQFPAGQAREPILGLRHSDAEAFCDWLTQRENAEWRYRLSTQKEALDYPMELPVQAQLGYWIVSVDDQTEFAWINSTPVDPRGIMHTLVLEPDLIQDLKSNNELNLDYVLETNFYHFARYMDIDGARDLERSFNLAVVLDRNLKPNRSFDLVINRSLGLARFLNAYQDRQIAINLYIDLYTLRERIAGRSPAFEGIRLVKERMR